jgi:hypothetical protein
MIEWIVDRPGIRLGLGDSVNYTGDADLVFTHIYGPLPKQLVGKPAIINVCGDKKVKAQEWCGAELMELGKWAKGHTNTLYAANFGGRYWTLASSLEDEVEDEFSPGRGWFPESLPRLVFEGIRVLFPSFEFQIVFDGFMGRGTIGKVARESYFDLDYVGIDRNPDRLTIAREYLNI